MGQSVIMLTEFSGLRAMQSTQQGCRGICMGGHPACAKMPLSSQLVNICSAFSQVPSSPAKQNSQ